MKFRTKKEIDSFAEFSVGMDMLMVVSFFH